MDLEYEEWDVLGCNAVLFGRSPCSSKMSMGFFLTTWPYNPQDHPLHNHQSENLKSRGWKSIFPTSFTARILRVLPMIHPTAFT